MNEGHIMLGAVTSFLTLALTLANALLFLGIPAVLMYLSTIRQKTSQSADRSYSILFLIEANKQPGPPVAIFSTEPIGSFWSSDTIKLL
jgi:hypothetical protein